MPPVSALAYRTDSTFLALKGAFMTKSLPGALHTFYVRTRGSITPRSTSASRFAATKITVKSKVPPCTTA